MHGKEVLGIFPSLNRLLLTGMLVLAFCITLYAQSAPNQTQPPPSEPATSPATNSNSDDVQRRIERARALAAAHQLESAASELEALRKSASDESVRSVTSVMLMGIYIEETNYARAESLLEDTFRLRSQRNDASIRTYFALAGQTVNGARSHLERYRDFGINVSNPDLPPEALADLDRLRSLLERMIAQAKEIAGDTKAFDSLALLEDVLGIRMSLARDAEDRSKWETEYASARELLASSQTQVASLRGVPNPFSTPAAKPPAPAASKEKPDSDTPTASGEGQSGSPLTAKTSATPNPANPATESATAGDANSSGSANTITTGSLNQRATKRVVPSYPAMAKSAGASGTVRVYVVVDEAGKVVDVPRSEGPMLLRQSAEQAARAWRFQPTAIDGKAVRLSGYIEFNFTL